MTNQINFYDIIDQIKCYANYCEYENIESTLLKEKVINASKIIIDFYKEKKITKKEFIDNMIKIRKIQLNSKVFTNFAKCALKNCYKLIEKLFDNLLLSNIKYKKPVKYTLKDFKNIMMLYLKFKEIMPIANSK